jgi:hypothetical protein
MIGPSKPVAPYLYMETSINGAGRECHVLRGRSCLIYLYILVDLTISETPVTRFGQRSFPKIAQFSHFFDTRHTHRRTAFFQAVSAFAALLDIFAGLGSYLERQTKNATRHPSTPFHQPAGSLHYGGTTTRVCVCCGEVVFKIGLFLKP